LKKDYIVDRISIESGEFNLRANKSGKVNYMVFKSDTSESTDLNLNIKKIIVNDFSILYQDEKMKIFAAMNVNKTSLKGLFNQSVYKLENESEIEIDSINFNQLTLIRNNHIIINSILNIDNQQKEYSLLKFEALLDEIKISADGKINDNQNKGFFIDFNFATQGMQLADIIPLLPDSFTGFDNLELNGLCDARAKIKGFSDGKNMPEVNMSFGLKNGSALFKNEKILFENITLEGNYSSKGDGLLEINQASFIHNNKNLNLNLKINNFKEPFINLQFKSDISPEALYLLSGNKMLDHLQGDMSFNLLVNGNLNDFKAKKFDKAKLTLTSDIRDLSFTNNNDRVETLKGRIVANESKINLNEFSGKFDKTNFLSINSFCFAVSNSESN